MGAADAQAVLDRISAARTKLILDRPFLGALVLRLELQAADPSWCTSTGTDAKTFFYNPDHIKSLKAAELQFTLSHEALHCALSHFARRQHRIKHRWDLACDYAINPILLDEGLTPPPGVMVMEEYRGMTAEEIYPLIDDNDQSETMDQHLYDKPDKQNEGGQDQQKNSLNQQNSHPDKDQAGEQQPPQKPQSSKRDEQQRNETSEKQSAIPPQEPSPASTPPPTLDTSEIDALQDKWQQRTAGAAQLAKQAGKMSALLSRFIDAEMAPKLSWRQLLATHLRATARDDYAYARPNNRRGDPAILPKLKSAQVNAIIAVDVSGSISDKELSECISEINAIKGQLSAKVTVIAIDDKIAPGFPQMFEAWEEIRFSHSIKGGGGTDFTPVFDWIGSQDIHPDVLVYFTDADGRFPPHAPDFPVVWLIKGKSSVPWGDRVQLN